MRDLLRGSLAFEERYGYRKIVEIECSLGIAYFGGFLIDLALCCQKTWIYSAIAAIGRGLPFTRIDSAFRKKRAAFHEE